MLRFKRTSEFLEWLRKLKDRDAKAKIEAHLDYCELKGSLLGDTKPVGDSIYEMRFHFGPGYRIYYARSGSEIYLLLIGGDKRKQQADIKKSQETIQGILRIGREKMTKKYQDYDTSEFLETEDDIAHYLNAVAEYNDPEMFQTALGKVAKARGMSSIAKEANVSRESLYRSLSAEGNPSFQTISKVLASMGLRLTIQPAEA